MSSLIIYINYSNLYHNKSTTLKGLTLTPQCFFGALTRFFPKNFGLTLDLRRSAHQTASAMQLQQSTLFRGCSHSVMFRLPCLLDPQVAPTAVTYRRPARPFTPGNENVVTQH